MAEWQVTDHGNNTYTVKQTGVSFGGGTISGIVAYVAALIGVAIMLSNVPVTLIFPALLAAGVLLVPVILRLGGGAGLLAALSVCAKYGHLMFSLLILVWWAMFTTGTASSALLTGMTVVSMYAMYYFPFYVAVHASGKDLDGAWPWIAAGLCFIGSLIFYIAIHDTVNDTFDYTAIYFPTALVVSGNFLVGVNTLLYHKGRGDGGKGLVALLLTVAILAGSILSVKYLFPSLAGATYENALERIEAGDYREAREILSRIKNNDDAAKKLEEIAFIGLEVGERVTIGKHAKDPDKPGTVPLTWTVVKVEEGKALLLCDSIVCCMDSNALSRWNEGNNVRGKLQDLYKYFDEEDRARIALSTVTTKAEAEFTSEDHLFLLSREELEAYCTDEKMLYTKEVTSYYKEQKAFETVLCYYTRSTDENGKWIVADCDDKTFTTRKSEGYRLTGVRPAMYIYNQAP
ncbi:MAG: hypothetical protein IKC75_02850 [Clostridia bacterium]|nr:hypothetical protein [Clostridia bacterium]